VKLQIKSSHHTRIPLILNVLHELPKSFPERLIKRAFPAHHAKPVDSIVLLVVISKSSKAFPRGSTSSGKYSFHVVDLVLPSTYGFLHKRMFLCRMFQIGSSAALNFEMKS
jgi:hypothetical protein